MAGARSALIIASYEYVDPELRQLRAPAQDAEALARVLGDPEIGGFDVSTVVNAPAHEISVAVERFFADRSTEDLLLLHFSGHGVKDESGDLYFAAANTQMSLLAATAVSADFVNRRMNRTRARRVVLLLDCCYAGAFERGLVSRGDTSLQLEERLAGRGRAVITASTAMEYAFEGQQLTDSTESPPSVFTSALVDGLATGDADTDQDGLVGLDELYDYVYERVRQVTPNQTPSKWALGVQGELVIAHRSRPVTTPSPLPDFLQEAVDSPLSGVRRSAVDELARVLRGRHAGQALAAKLALESLSQDDSRSVAAAATAVLAGAGSTPGPAEGDGGQEAKEGHPVHRERPIKRTEQKPPTERGRGTTGTGTTETVRKTTRRDRASDWLAARSHRVVAALVGALVVALGVGGVVYLVNGSSPDAPAVLSTRSILLTDVVDGQRRLLAVDVDSPGSQPTVVPTEATPFGASVSPDRRTIAYTTPAGAHGRVVRLMSPDGSGDHLLFGSGDPCTTSALPAWRSDGKQLAVICDDNGTNKLVIISPDGSLIENLVTTGYLSGVPTWGIYKGRQVVVYEQSASQGGPIQLWASYPQDPTEPAGAVIESSASDSHADYANHRLLFLRRSDPSSETAAAMLAVESADGQVSTQRVPGLAHVQSATWSPDGTEIAFVADGWLRTTKPDSSSDQQQLVRVSVQTVLAWGSH